MYLQALHILGQGDLAAQPRGVRQFVRQIQHVQLLITGFVGQFLEIAGLEDQVAGGAGQRAFTGPETIQIHIVVDDHVQQGVTHFSRRLDLVPIGTHEGYVNTAIARLVNVYAALAVWSYHCSARGVGKILTHLSFSGPIPSRKYALRSAIAN